MTHFLRRIGVGVAIGVSLGLGAVTSAQEASMTQHPAPEPAFDCIRLEGGRIDAAEFDLLCAAVKLALRDASAATGGRAVLRVTAASSTAMRARLDWTTTDGRTVEGQDLGTAIADRTLGPTMRQEFALMLVRSLGHAIEK
jgi:hypothetical protein